MGAVAGPVPGGRLRACRARLARRACDGGARPGNAVPAEESDELYGRWSIPAPGKPLFEAAAANFSLHSPAKVRTDNSERGAVADECLSWLGKQGV